MRCMLLIFLVNYTYSDNTFGIEVSRDLSWCLRWEYDMPSSVFGDHSRLITTV